MDPSVSKYIEYSVLLIIVLVLFTSARHVAIYGRNSASNWAFGICIVFSAIGGVTFGGQITKQISSLGQANITDGRQHASPMARESFMRSVALNKYVETGEITSYAAASGESVRFQPAMTDMDRRRDWLVKSSQLENANRAFRERQMIWLLTWIPVVLLGYLVGRIEYAHLVRKYQFSRIVKDHSRIVKPNTFAEVEGFVGLLKAACDEPEMNSTLQTILAQPDAGRKSMIRDLLVQFKEKGAPQVLSDAFICLMDNEVAEKVYVYIHKCERPSA